MAAERALASRDPDPGLRNPDWLADRLVGPEELALISEHPVSKALQQSYSEAMANPQVVISAWLMLLRTRYIDAALERAVANGATQIVILGAGFDSRAYRFRELLQHCRVVEIDAAATQQHKRRRLEAIACQIPRNLSYATIDFAQDSLSAVLTASGIRQTEKTFYIWEGVCMYVPEQGVRETLQTVASYSAAGSSLVLDYANRRWLEFAPEISHGGSVEIFRSWGEPWIFGVPNPDGQEFFRELGFDPGTPMSFNDPALFRKYTTNGEGKMYGAHIFAQMRAQRKAAEAPKRPPVYWLTQLTV